MKLARILVSRICSAQLIIPSVSVGDETFVPFVCVKKKQLDLFAYYLSGERADKAIS